MINVEGLDKLKIQFKRLEGWPRQAEQIVDKHLNIIVTTAKLISPVDTGVMKAGIKSLGTKISGDLISGTVLSPADYSSFVEEGTRFQKAQPFLEPAVQSALENLIAELIQKFESIFD